MPYELRKVDKKFCVFNKDTDENKGCSDTKDQAVAHLRALYANEAEYAAEEALELLNEETISGDSFEFSDSMKEYKWEGPICFEEVTTGDNRIFKSDAINWQEETLPWAFRWQKASGQGHAGSVPVGRVDRIERMEDGSIHGYGVVIPELSDEAAEYLKLLESGVGGGVSVDGDSAQFEIQETEGGQPRVEFSAMRLRALSAVDIPAFNGARIHLIKDESVTASGEELEVSISFGNINDETGEIEITEVVEAIDFREELDKKKAKKKKVSYGWAVDESLVAAAIPTLPSTDAFLDPEFEGPVGLTVTPDGRVFGHLALFNTCHIGFPGTCVKPPKGSSYQYFHTGQIETAEGDLVDCGKLTFKTGHADMNASPRIAADHYDNTGTVAADVRAGEDKFGIWVVGALRPHLSDEDIRAFRAAPLSGDWRRIAGKLELVGALGVNTPGFPVPRVRALVASGETETLFTFLEDDDEEFKFSDYELTLRYDKKAALASMVGEFAVEKTPTTEITEEVPENPTKKDFEERGKKYTRSQLMSDLKDVRDLLDDEDVEMNSTTRKNLEALYAIFVKTDDSGKRTEASGLDVDELTPEDIEGFYADWALSGQSIEEFYNTCHGPSGRFCPTGGSGGGISGQARGGGGQRGQRGQQGRGQRGQQGRGQQGQQGRGPRNFKAPTGAGKEPTQLYRNYRRSRDIGLKWAAAGALAAGLLAFPLAGAVASAIVSPVSPLLASPVSMLALATAGLVNSKKHLSDARANKKLFNVEVDKVNKKEKVEEHVERVRKSAGII